MKASPLSHADAPVAKMATEAARNSGARILLPPSLKRRVIAARESRKKGLLADGMESRKRYSRVSSVRSARVRKENKVATPFCTMWE